MEKRSLHKYTLEPKETKLETHQTKYYMVDSKTFVLMMLGVIAISVIFIFGIIAVFSPQVLS
ncbi:MAG: hypothetical protein J4432_02490 [DPANN group archaeon]|nr:hypothetical protein [DPANN group archaeon]